MSVEKLGETALAYRKRCANYTYFQVEHLSYAVTDRFPDMPTNAWMLASWFYKSYTQSILSKIDNYMIVTGVIVISRLSMFHIRSRSTVTKLFQRLVDDGFLITKSFPNPMKASGYDVGYMPTQLMRELCVYDIALDSQNSESINSPENATEGDEDPISEPEVLSDTLFDFYALLKKATTAFDHHKPPSNDKPSKLWLNTDKYIKELMEGTFYENNKDKFDKKTEDRGAIPKLTLPQIADLCKNVKVYSANGKPSIDNVFMQFDGKVFKSPLLNYIWASLPPPMPTYSPEHIEELKAKYLSSKEMLSTVALNKASINRDNPYIYLLMDKMMDFFDDETRERLGKYNKKAPTKLDLTHLPDWCIMSFNSYRDSWKKKATWQTWEEWVQAFKVDDRKKYTPWFWMLYWVRKNSNGRFHLSEDTSIRTKIDDMIAHPYVGEDNGGY
jgi:hypothetical protein